MENIKKNLPAAVFFIIVFGLFFSSVIFGNKTLMSYGPNTFPDSRADQKYYKNSVQDDGAPSWIDVPYSVLNHSFLSKRRLPLWNQYSAIGHPLAADLESASYFPFHLPSIFGLKAWDTYIILRLLVSAVFLYLFLREMNLRTIPALVGGFLYSFTGYFAYYLNNFIINVDMLLPLGLYLSTRYIKGPSAAKFMGLTCTFFLILNGGNPQSSLLGLAFINFFYVYEALSDKANQKKRLASLADLFFVNLLSFGLSAFNYLPFIELLRNSWTIHPPGVSLIHMEPVALLNFIYPFILGYLRGDVYNQIISTRIIPYFGIFSSWLAILGVFYHNRRREAVFFGSIAFLWFFKLLGFPLLDPLLRMPVLSNIWFNKYTATLFLSVSILAAFGSNSFIDILKRKTHSTGKPLKALVPIVVAVFIFAGLNMASRFLGLDVGIKNIIPSAIDDFFIKANFSNRMLIGSAFFQWHRLFSILSIIFSLGLLISLYKKTNLKIFHLIPILILSVVVVEGYIYFPKIRYNKFDPGHKFSYVDFLKKDKEMYRVYGTEQTAMAQQNIFYGINDIRIVSPLLYERYATFFRELLINQPKEQYHPYLGSRDTTMKHVNNKILSLLNVKYVLSNNAFPTNKDYKLVYDNDLKVYKNLNHLPRAFLVDNVVLLSSKQDILGYLKRPSFQPRDEVVVENMPKELAKKIAFPSKKTGASKVEISQYDPTEVTISVEAVDDKLLVISDLYYPGWRVLVDGKESVVFAANYVMRGVYIPKGNHSVKFVYRPESLAAGLVFSALSFILLTAIATIKFKGQNYDKKTR